MHDLDRAFADLTASAASGDFEAAASHSPLATVTARRHPLNFVVLKLDDGAGTALRLHLWANEFDFGQPGFEVHDHAFDFDSVVVQGRVAQTIYRAEAIHGAKLDTFEVSYGAIGSTLRPAGRPVALRQTSRDEFSTGDRYHLGHGVLHRLEPLTPRAITLVLTHDRGGSPVTIGPTGGAKPVLAHRSEVLGDDGLPLTLKRNGLEAIVDAALSGNTGLCSQI